jgi:PAS domain S-box-containing protein
MDTPFRILIIADQEDQARLLQHTLASSGSPIETSWVNFRNALHVLRRESTWDTGILIGQDIHPGFVTLLEKIVALQPGLPVIALAEPFTPQVVLEMMDRGAARYLPVDRMHLVPSLLSQKNWRTRIHRTHPGDKDLEQLTKRFKPFMDLSPDGMAITDLEGELMHVNLRAAEIFGFANPEDMRGMYYLDLISDEDRGMVARQVESAEDGGQTQIIESRVKRLDGSEITMEMNTAMIHDADGNPAGYLGIGRDITGRKQAEQAIRDSEAFAQKILASSLNGIYVYDMKAGIITFINPQYTQLTGYTLADLRAMGPEEFLSHFHPDDKEKVLAHIDQVASSADGIIVEVDYRFKTADDRWIWCLSRETVFSRSPDGSVSQYIGTFLDITERKQLDEKLRLTREFYQAILEDQTEMICRFKPDGTVTYVNGAYSRFLGVERDKFLGRHISQYVPQVEYPSFIESLANLTVERPVVINLSLTERAVGEPRWILWTDRMIPGKDGMVAEYQSVGSDITDLKTIESTLQKERNFYSAILDTGSALVIILDPDGDVLRVNRACETISGFSSSEILGRGLWKRVILKDDGDRLWTYFSELKNGNHNRNIVTSWKTREGSLRYILWTTTILADDHQNIEYIVATGIDITERNKAVEEIHRLNADLETRVAMRTAELEKTNQELREEINKRLHVTESRTQMIEILEETPDIVTIGDVEGNLSYLNKAGRQLMGLPDDLDITGLQQRVPYSPAAFSRVLAEAYPYALAHGVWSGESTYLDAGGNEIPILLVVIAHRKENGKVQYLSTIARDISARKLVEQQLRESEAGFRSVFEGSPIGIVISTAEGKAIQTNPAFLQMLGSSEEEMCNMDLLEITHPDDRAMNLAYLQEARAGKIDQYTLEKRYCKKDGDELWARIYSSMVRGADNQILFIISMVEDITESQKIRQELQHALEQEKELSELKSRFVTMTSHEFRTPLSTILSSAELLEHYSHRWSDQKKVDHLRRIQTAVKHLTGMLDEVLVIGRVEAGMVTVDLASLDLLEVMADLVEEISLGVGAQHEIHFTCPESSFLVRMDEGLLRQILLNLLTNAVKYSPAGSRIDLELRRNDGQILIQISDEGVGIPDEDLSRLFEPFYRGQNTNHIPGTGLGLAIVKRSLDHLHGTITVNSQERVGTTFIVEIPIPAESDDDSLDLTGFLQD